MKEVMLDLMVKLAIIHLSFTSAADWQSKEEPK